MWLNIIVRQKVVTKVDFIIIIIINKDIYVYNKYKYI